MASGRETGWANFVRTEEEILVSLKSKKVVDSFQPSTGMLGTKPDVDNFRKIHLVFEALACKTAGKKA